MGIDSLSLTKCGYLYNWYTATAGSGTAAITSGDVGSSICPANWRLPKYNATAANNDFAVLNGKMYDGSASSTGTGTAYAKNWWTTGPFVGTYSGSYASSMSNQGYYGYYWSATAAAAANAYNANFYYSALSIGTSATKVTGYAVRCML
jgi:uncharacterized protein (TIGR02145 family)